MSSTRYAVVDTAADCTPSVSPTMAGTSRSFAPADNGNNGRFICFIAQDTLGNTSTQSQLIRNIGLPAPPSTPDLAVGSDTGTSDTDDITNDTTPTFSVGGVEDGATVQVTATRLGESDVTNTETATGTTASVTLPTLTEGTWSITATQEVTGSTALVTGTSPASSALSVTITTGMPTIASIRRQTPGTELTRADTVIWQVTFDMAVTGVDISDFSVTGTTATASTVTGSDAVYDVTVTGGDLADLNDTISLELASSVAIMDLAGNSLFTTLPTDANNESYIIDNTAPTIVIAASGGGATDRVYNATVNDPAGVGMSSTRYAVVDTATDCTPSVSPTMAGTSRSFAPADNGNNGRFICFIAQDTLGNTSTQSQLIRNIGLPAPPSTPDLAVGSDTGTSDTDDITNDTTPTFSVGGVEDGATVQVTATRLGESDVTNTETATGTTASVTLPTLTEGTWSITATQEVTGSTALVTGTSPASSALSVTITTGMPTIASIRRQTPGTELTRADTVIWQVTFDMAVTGVDISDFSVTGTTATASTVTGSDAVYDVTVTGGDLADLDGPISLGLAAGTPTITDFIGNSLSTTLPTGTDNESYIIDNAAPTVTINTSNVSGSILTLTIRFNEAVSGFTISDITVRGGSVSGFSGSGRDYSTQFTLSGSSTNASVSVAAGVAMDTSGNPNQASTTVSFMEPGTPGNVSGRAQGMDNIVLTWTAPTNDGGTPITGYRIERSTVPAGPLVVIADTSTSATTYTDNNNLMQGARYVYRVRATNAIGTGAFSTFSEPITAGALTEAAVSAINNEIVMDVTRSVQASVTHRLQSRIDVLSGAELSQTANYQLGGQAISAENYKETIHNLLSRYSGNIETVNWQELINGTSMILPLGDFAKEVSSHLSDVTLWLEGSYKNLDDDQGGETIRWDGDIVSASLGMDMRYKEDILLGSALSWSTGKFDYSDFRLGGTTATSEGVYEYDLFSVHPYLAWSCDDLTLWGSLGFGRGKFEISQNNITMRVNGHISYYNLTGGFKERLLKREYGEGENILSVKGDLSWGRTDLSGDGVAEESLYGGRARLLLEGKHRFELAGGEVLEPILEIGGRYDDGDGSEGLGGELGLGLQYEGTQGFTVRADLRRLFFSDYEEWGGRLLLKVNPDTEGRGLGLSIAPSWGSVASRSDELWNSSRLSDINQNLSVGGDNASLSGELSYGLLNGSDSLLTPYLSTQLSSEQSEYRAGSRYHHSELLELDFSAARLSGRQEDRQILLELGINF